MKASFLLIVDRLKHRTIYSLKKTIGSIPCWPVIIMALGGLLVHQESRADKSPIYASWYGQEGDTCDPWPHFTTASGRRFNENELTCAHPSYPFGTLLRITRLEPNKATHRKTKVRGSAKRNNSVVVLVTDRGPAKRLVAKGRAVDLSKLAFSRLAKLSEGLVPIKIEVLRYGYPTLRSKHRHVRSASKL